MSTTKLPDQIAPGTVTITEDPATMAAYGITPRAGWALVLIGRASKAKKFTITPAEEVALHAALAKRPAVRAKAKPEMARARREGTGRAAPLTPVTEGDKQSA